MKHLHHLVAAAVALCAAQVHAFTATVTNDITSPQAGVVTETFQGAAMFSRSGGGAVFNSDSAGAQLTTDNIYLIPAISAQPKKGGVFADDKWFSVAANDPSAVFTFTGGTTYVGFLWGSVDLGNRVTFFDTHAVEIASFYGGPAGLANFQVPTGTGLQSESLYFGFSDSSIGSVRFTSLTNSFEIDNLSAVAAVPEPETYALMLGGLAAVGFVARRRRSA